MTRLGLVALPIADAAEGMSPLYAAIGEKLAAIIAVSNPVKETTPQATRALHDLTPARATTGPTG